MTLEENLVQPKQVPNMTFKSVFKAMLPSVAVGTLAAMGCQELASKCHANPEYITLSGMAAQYVGGWAPFLFLHYQNNKHRLRKPDGKIDYRTFGQDLGAVLASDQVGNKVWAGSYALVNEIALRSGVDPATAGLLSGTSSGTLYTAFTAYVAPRVNTVINCIKNKVKHTSK